VTRIPKEHTGARKLQEEFERLGRDDGRQFPRRSRRGVAWCAAALVLASAAVGTAATSLRHDNTPLHHEGKLPPAIARAPRDMSVSPARAADPAGGLAWGARTYSSRTGARCVVIGRIQHGLIGVLHGDRFERLARNAPGTCTGPSNAHIALAVRIYPLPDAGRSVLFGVADRRISRIATVAGGRLVDVPIAADGVFLRVARGRRAFNGVMLRYVESGRVHRTVLVR
jgi:hypothetical protein